MDGTGWQAGRGRGGGGGGVFVKGGHALKKNTVTCIILLVYNYESLYIESGSRQQ